MTVPAPHVLPVLQPGSSNIGRYIGPLPGLMPGQPLRVDLKFFSVSVRNSANFRQNMRVTVKSNDGNLTGPGGTTQPQGNSEFIAFFDTPGVPNEYLEISGLDFVSGVEQHILQVENVVSIAR